MIDCLVSCFRISPHNNQHFKVRALVFIQLCLLMLLILYECVETRKMNRLHLYWYLSILYTNVNFKTLKILFLKAFFIVPLILICITEYFSCNTLLFFLSFVDLLGSEFPFYISLCAGKFTPSNHHQCKSKRYC